jgi:hypothetical protein
MGKGWEEIARIEVAKGENKLLIPLPWQTLDLIAYPTNFAKVINGRNFNVYHFVHIWQLEKLHQYTGNKVFAEWANKWKAYQEEWPKMPLYEGVQHIHHSQWKDE